MSRWLLRTLREVAETVIPAVVIALVINLFLAQATQVLGQSMEPNLHTAQRVVVEKVTYRFFHGPRRGDIVVFEDPQGSGENLVKRVAAVAGDHVALRDNVVWGVYIINFIFFGEFYIFPHFGIMHIYQALRRPDPIRLGMRIIF